MRYCDVDIAEAKVQVAVLHRPYRGELIMEGEEALSKNLLDYLHYKKYSADSEITYDIPKDLSPIPDVSLRTPAVKARVDCKDPKNKDAAECKTGK